MAHTRLATIVLNSRSTGPAVRSPITFHTEQTLTFLLHLQSAFSKVGINEVRSSSAEGD